MNKAIQAIVKMYGNRWPQAALDRLLILRAAGWIHTQEYRDLLKWAKETIEAGVAFQRQTD